MGSVYYFALASCLTIGYLTDSIQVCGAPWEQWATNGSEKQGQI